MNSSMSIHEVLAEQPTLTAFADRARTLSANMAGFDGLVMFVQAALVVESLVMNDLWETDTYEETRKVAYNVMADHHALVIHWGLEK